MLQLILYLYQNIPDANRFVKSLCQNPLCGLHAGCRKRLRYPDQARAKVLALVAQGYTSAEIADQWVVSRRTLEVHRSNMMRKLHLKTQADVIRFALRRGLLLVEE